MFNERLVTYEAHRLKLDYKTTKGIKSTLKARTMITKREMSCLGMKQNIDNLKEDKYKLMRRSSQNDKLEQWVMHRAVKDEVLGSILGCNKQKVFFDL